LHAGDNDGELSEEELLAWASLFDKSFTSFDSLPQDLRVLVEKSKYEAVEGLLQYLPEEEAGEEDLERMLTTMREVKPTDTPGSARGVLPLTPIYLQVWIQFLCFLHLLPLSTLPACLPACLRACLPACLLLMMMTSKHTGGNDGSDARSTADRRICRAELPSSRPHHSITVAHC